MSEPDRRPDHHPGTSTATRTTSWLVVAAATVIVVAPIAAAVRAMRGWVPTSDWAVVVARSADTFTRHPPLIGQISSVSRNVGQPVSQLGPLQYWILGVFGKITAPSTAGDLIGSAAIAVAAFATIIIVAWRRARLTGVVATVAMLALLTAGLGADSLRMPYNPTAAVWSFVGFIGAIWAASNRDRWWLPAAVFFGSLSVQSHLTFVVPVVLTALVWIGITIRDFAQSMRNGTSFSLSPRVVVSSVVVALICWSGPLFDQVARSGNLGLVFSAGTSGIEPVGFGFALRRLLVELQIPPSWVHNPFSPASIGEIVVIGKWPYELQPVTPWQLASAAIVTVALIWSLVHTWRRRERSLFTCGSLTIAALVGATVSTAMLPETAIAIASTVNQVVYWPIAAATWLFLALTIADVIAPRLRHAVPASARTAVGVALAVALAVAVTLSTAHIVVAARPSADAGSITYGAIDQFAQVVNDACARDGGTVAINADGSTILTVLPGVVALARKSGCNIRMAIPTSFGPTYRATGNERTSFFISVTPDVPGYRLVSTFGADQHGTRWADYRSTGTLVIPPPYHLLERTR
ncbi:MAG: hypothetical protein JST73_06770 [Actinobacteria bacterium]|nr:hypothetical protein [Actinomycetota bacterium]